MARPKIGMAKTRGKWAEALEACEDVFQYHPWEVHVAHDAADAAEHLKLPALARWYLESVFQQVGEDAHFYRHLAHVYELNQMWETSIRCWEKVHKLVPTDEEANKKIKSLTANAAISRSGIDEAARKVPAGNAGPEPATSPMSKSSKRQAMTPEQRLRQRIQDEPAYAGAYLELADMYKLQNKLDDAEKVLAAGRKATNDDAVLLEAHADVQIAPFGATGGLVQEAPQDPTDLNAKDRLDKLTAMLLDYELKEYERHSRTPARGTRHATSSFASAWSAPAAPTRRSPSSSKPATRMPPESAARPSTNSPSASWPNLPKLGERYYQEALKLAEEDADQAKIKELHYCLGCVYLENSNGFHTPRNTSTRSRPPTTPTRTSPTLENLNRQGQV